MVAGARCERQRRSLRLLSLSALLSSTTCLHCATAPARQLSAPHTSLPPHRYRRLSNSPLLSLQTEEKPKQLFSFARPRAQEPVSELAGDASEAKLATAGGVLASSALIAEAVQIAGTAVLFYFGQQWTGTSDPVEAVAYMIDFLQQAGPAGYAYFAAAMITLQVIPVAAAFVLTVSAGAIFGAVKGTATVLTCSTISATISFLIARQFGRAKLMDAARESKQFRAIDAAFAEAEFGTSLTLITLLRLSPVLPFAWANYIFGLSPVPTAAFSIGTFVGCLPAVVTLAHPHATAACPSFCRLALTVRLSGCAQFGYVSAGQVGAEIAVSGADSNPAVLALGIAATIGAITYAGKIATGALKDLDLDLED